jgi:ribonuclease BN (tRNA processing enzyme)
VAEGEGRGPRVRGAEIAVGTLKITVAGSSCSIPRSDRACSSYVLRDGDLMVSLDFGTGAFANMRSYVDYDRLDGIVISHMHADHFLDLIPLRYAIKYGSKRRNAKLPLWMPPGGIATLRTLVSAFASEGHGDFIDECFNIREFDPKKGLPLGNGKLRFAATTHYVPSYAIRYERNGTSFTYSADTAPDDRVVELAQGSDLFLCEATLLANDEEFGPRGHCTAAEAAAMAAAARVKRLVLTHYSQDATEKDLTGATRGIFTGDVHVPHDHDVLEI